jgi:hypothetical protein
MITTGRCSLLLSVILAVNAAAADDASKLSKERYVKAAGQLSVIMLEVNWGRQWNCDVYENAQIQKLEFSSFPADENERQRIRLKTPSKLTSKDRYDPIAMLVEPGTYAITGFDIKVARSMTDVGHFVGTTADLIKDGEPVGGTFTIDAGEIIYLGHFSLDCDEGIMPWRYYLSDRSEFERYVARFREWYPFTADTPVEYRLFSTSTMGIPHAMEDPVVP